MEEVIYKPVVGYEGLYEVSSLGEVFSLNYRLTGKRVKLKAEVSRGYQQVRLYKDNKSKKLKVHILVAKAFIPNLDGKPQIDHINTDKTDNRVENLRWVTPAENMNNPITRVAHEEAIKRLERDPEWQRKHNDAMHKLAQDPEFMRRRNEATSKANSKAVYCVELNMVFDSATEVARQLGLNNSAVSACCLGKRMTHGGYHFHYIQE